MEEQYVEALKFFEEKKYIEALKAFSSINWKDSKTYENKCIDYLEDLIYYSSFKMAKNYLSELKFYKDYSYFLDAYHRKKVNLISMIMMFGAAGIATIILILLFI
ncbi:MAG: hypothetical protein K2I42_01220 [Anaeroplasmataceae bacterium]|nr:hypothetical protein [Anaeroplasmataceae bacterium]